MKEGILFKKEDMLVLNEAANSIDKNKNFLKKRQLTDKLLENQYNKIWET